MTYRTSKALSSYYGLLPYSMKAEFEKKLSDLGFTYQSNPDDVYILRPNNDFALTLHVQLRCSELVDEIKYGSLNGIEIESIGLLNLN